MTLPRDSAAFDLTPDCAPIRDLAISALEADVIAVLDASVGAFDRVVQLLAHPAGSAFATQDQLGVRAPFAETLNHRTVAMLGTGIAAPELRRVAALLHITACIERIAARCAALARLMTGPTPVLSADPRVRRAGELELIATRQRLLLARDAVRTARTPPAPAPGRALVVLAAAVHEARPGPRGLVCAAVRLADLLDQIDVEAANIGEAAGSIA